MPMLEFNCRQCKKLTKMIIWEVCDTLPFGTEVLFCTVCEKASVELLVGINETA